MPTLRRHLRRVLRITLRVLRVGLLGITLRLLRVRLLRIALRLLWVWLLGRLAIWLLGRISALRRLLPTAGRWLRGDAHERTRYAGIFLRWLRNPL